MDSRLREHAGHVARMRRGAPTSGETPHVARGVPLSHWPSLPQARELGREVRGGAQVAQAREALERLQLAEQRSRALLAQFGVGAVVELRGQLLARERPLPVTARELDVGALEAPSVG